MWRLGLTYNNCDETGIFVTQSAYDMIDITQQQTGNETGGR